MDDRCSVMLTSDLVCGGVALVDKSNLPNNNGLLPTPNGGSPHQYCDGVVIMKCTHSPTHRTDAHLFLSTSFVSHRKLLRAKLDQLMRMWASDPTSAIHLHYLVVNFSNNGSQIDYTILLYGR